MGQRLAGKNAVVTGSSFGIGKEIALALAAEGARVVVNSSGSGPEGPGTNLKPLNDVVDEIKAKGGVAISSCGSVVDFAYAEKLIQTCVNSFGSIDILVNNAGIGGGGLIASISEEDFDIMIAVHLKGTFNLCRHAAPIMMEQNKGRIINTASIGWLGLPFAAAYSAAKGGIVSLTISLAREMKLMCPGVTCNAITPEALTRLTAHPGLKDSLQVQYQSGLISKKRMEIYSDMAGPEHIAPIVLYLATDEAANITGKVFRCGGGAVALYAEPNELKGIYKDYKKHGVWTLDELVELMPQTLAEEMA